MIALQVPKNIDEITKVLLFKLCKQMGYGFNVLAPVPVDGPCWKVRA